MKVTVADSIRRDSQLLARIEQACRLLEVEVGPSADRVTADWTLLADDRGRPLVELKLSDRSGTVIGRFAPDERGEGAMNEEKRVRIVP